MAQIDGMVAEFVRMSSELDNQIRAEESGPGSRTSAISRTRPSRRRRCSAATISAPRRTSSAPSADVARAGLAVAEEELQKLEAIAERDHDRDRIEDDAAMPGATGRSQGGRLSRPRKTRHRSIPNRQPVRAGSGKPGAASPSRVRTGAGRAMPAVDAARAKWFRACGLRRCNPKRAVICDRVSTPERVGAYPGPHRWWDPRKWWFPAAAREDTDGEDRPGRGGQRAQHEALPSSLEASGYDTIQTRSGLEAIHLAREHRPDLILMDIQLPEVCPGLEVTKWIKEDDDLRAISIIAVTAFAMKGDEDRIRQGGCEAYLSKPMAGSSSRP